MKRTDRIGIAMTLVITMFTMGVWACAPQVADTPARQPIFQRAEELAKLPTRIPKPEKATGTVLPMRKGDQAPFDGIIFTEERAKRAAELRIGYDELYDIASINGRFIGVALRAADAQLAAADKEVAKLRADRNSWWNRNKLVVGLVLGTLLTLGIGGFAVWGAGQLRK